LISLGEKRWPRPCRARNATRRPSRVPATMLSDGSLNGVFTRSSSASLSPALVHSPLPPIMPTLTASVLRCVFVDLAILSPPSQVLASTAPRARGDKPRGYAGRVRRVRSTPREPPVESTFSYSLVFAWGKGRTP